MKIIVAILCLAVPATALQQTPPIPFEWPAGSYNDGPPDPRTSGVTRLDDPRTGVAYDDLKPQWRAAYDELRPTPFGYLSRSGDIDLTGRAMFGYVLANHLVFLRGKGVPAGGPAVFSPRGKWYSVNNRGGHGPPWIWGAAGLNDHWDLLWQTWRFGIIGVGGPGPFSLPEFERSGQFTSMGWGSWHVTMTLRLRQNWERWMRYNQLNHPWCKPTGAWNCGGPYPFVKRRVATYASTGRPVGG